MKHHVQSYILAPEATRLQVREKILEIAELLPTGSCVFGIWNTEKPEQLSSFITSLRQEKENFWKFLSTLSRLQYNNVYCPPDDGGHKFTFIQKTRRMTPEQADHLDTCVQEIVDLLGGGSVFAIIIEEGEESEDLEILSLARIARDSDAQTFLYMATEQMKQNTWAQEHPEYFN